MTLQAWTLQAWLATIVSGLFCLSPTFLMAAPEDAPLAVDQGDASHVPTAKSLDDGPGFMQQPLDRIKSVWESGTSDLYLPLHAYHVRSNYTREEINDFRENTWGMGYGRSRITASGNWEGVYGMAFLDSNSKVEPVIGYAYQWTKGDPNALNAGIGYTAMLTARSNFAHYLPFPAILPMASLGYQKVSLNSAYVPGVQGFGQIFFFWSRVSF